MEKFTRCAQKQSRLGRKDAYLTLALYRRKESMTIHMVFWERREARMELGLYQTPPRKMNKRPKTTNLEFMHEE